MAKNKQKGHLVTANNPNDDVAIWVEHVSKSFILPHNKQNSIKGGLINIFNGDRSYEVQEVLKDVSFEIKKGEFFGIVGRNGSGKSTLLKMLAGIYTPSEGKIIINGSLTPFIELGVGFNPELTGRENVFLNGALLGFSRNEMVDMYNDIVEFAELERFMDQKLKNYSSGMQVRLAFSIAIRAKSDILLIDEVLAVGDVAFQQKCFTYFDKLKEEKRTIILVTHDMGAVKQFCDKAILVHNGSIKQIGSAEVVSGTYEKINFENKKEMDQAPEQGVAVTILDDKDKIASNFAFGETINIKIDWKNSNSTVYNVGVVLLRGVEDVFATNTKGQNLNIIKSKNISLKLKPQIGDGRYKFNIVLFGKTDHDIIETATTDYITLFQQPSKIHQTEWAGITYINNEWSK